MRRPNHVNQPEFLIDKSILSLKISSYVKIFYIPRSLFYILYKFGSNESIGLLFFHNFYYLNTKLFQESAAKRRGAGGPLHNRDGTAGGGEAAGDEPIVR